MKKISFRSFLWGLLPLFVLAHFAHHLLPGMLTPLLPFIRDDLALDYTQAGWIISAFTIAYGVSQLPAGWLADHIGPRIVLTIGISGVALAGILVGISPTYFMVMAFLVLLGLLGGGYHPSSAPLVSAAVEPKNQGSALGIHQIGGSAGFFLTPLITAAIASALGWRGSFIAVAIPIFIIGVVVYVLLGRFGYVKKTQQRVSTTPVGVSPIAGGSSRRLTAVIILGIAVQTFVWSVISFIPLFIVDRFNVSKEAAAAFLTIVYAGGLWAGPLGGYLSDRFGRVPVVAGVSVIAGIVIYLLNVAPFGWVMSLVLIVVGTSYFLSLPVFESYIIKHTSEHNRSTVLGVYYTGSRGGPGAMAPALGYLADHFGFYTGFTLTGAAMFATAIVCSVLLWGSRD